MGVALVVLEAGGFVLISGGAGELEQDCTSSPDATSNTMGNILKMALIALLYKIATAMFNFNTGGSGGKISLLTRNIMSHTGVPEEALQFVGITLNSAVGFTSTLQDSRKLSMACFIVITFTILDIEPLLLLF